MRRLLVSSGNDLRLLFLWGPVLVAMAAIFYVSSLHEAPLPDDVSDKSGHVLAYTALGVTVVRAVAGGLPRRITARIAAVAIAMTVAYGASDELHQAFVAGTQRGDCGPLRRRGRCDRRHNRLLGVGYNSAPPRTSIEATMTFENLTLDWDGAVVVLTINRPQVLNALNSQTIDELRRAVLELKHDAFVRAVILTGAGEKSFVAGADINELAVHSPAQGKEHALRGQHVFDIIENMGKPVIAAINGYALGGGCELAMACTSAARGRDGAARPAGDQPRDHPRVRRHAAPAAAGRQGHRARPAADRTSDHRAGGAADRPREPRRAGGRPDGRSEAAGGGAGDEGADRGAVHHRGGEPWTRAALRQGAVPRGDAVRPRRVDRRTCAKARPRFSRSARRTSRASSRTGRVGRKG